MTIGIFLPFYRQMESKTLLFHSKSGKKGCRKTLQKIYEGQEPALSDAGERN